VRQLQINETKNIGFDNNGNEVKIIKRKAGDDWF
jgi:hypothetical protein